VVTPAGSAVRSYSGGHDSSGRHDRELAVTAGQPTDRYLVDAVLSGDDEAFRVLVDRESANVIAGCWRILGDPHEAEDVAQEAFLQAYRALPTFRGDGPFGAWVWRIATRMAIARLKRPGALQADPTREAGWLEEHDGEADPQANALAGERRAEVMQAISTLPEAQRRTVAMRFYGDMSLEEIAAATGAPVGTVKSRLHRAMAALRERLGG
jgi:RNA polymerase sigma-70 factor (ECF subfamily)